MFNFLEIKMVGALGFEPRPADIFYVISHQTGQRSSWSSAKQRSSCLHSCSNPVQLEPAILPGYTIPPLVTTRIHLGLSTQRLYNISENEKNIKFKLLLLFVLFYVGVAFFYAISIFDSQFSSKHENLSSW